MQIKQICWKKKQQKNVNMNKSENINRLVQETNHHIKILVEMIQVQIFNKEQ